MAKLSTSEFWADAERIELPPQPLAVTPLPDEPGDYICVSRRNADGSITDWWIAYEELDVVESEDSE